jgi:hypothetical protein
MSFWEDAFTGLSDNLTLIGTAVLDGTDNINPFSDAFLSGDAKRTAAEAERQNAEREGRAYDERRAEASAKGGLATIEEGVRATGADVGKKAGEVLSAGGKAAGSALDALTNPWIVGPVLVLVALVVAAPYVTPLLPKRA